MPILRLITAKSTEKRFFVKKRHSRTPAESFSEGGPLS
jgi:hypothetical protein